MFESFIACIFHVRNWATWKWQNMMFWYLRCFWSILCLRTHCRVSIFPEKGKELFFCLEYFSLEKQRKDMDLSLCRKCQHISWWMKETESPECGDSGSFDFDSDWKVQQICEENATGIEIRNADRLKMIRNEMKLHVLRDLCKSCHKGSGMMRQAHWKGQSRDLYDFNHEDLLLWHVWRRERRKTVLARRECGSVLIYGIYCSRDADYKRWNICGECH